MKLFNLDSGLMRSLSKFTDCICLSLLFFVSCIPVITTGTACTAMYYTTHKVLRHARGYLFRDYISAFRDNFKKTTVAWVLALIIGGVLWVDLYIMNFYAKEGSPLGPLAVFFVVGMAIWFAWVSWLFPYMARFENSVRQSMKNAILMTIVHLPMTVLMLVLAVITGLVFYMVPVLIFLLPAVYTWIQSYILERVFRKYMSEEDRMAEDEKYKEDLY